MLDLSNLKVGKEYDRPGLADEWGYKSHNAIGRGVVTPKDDNKVILFVTEEKQESLTQYKDRIDQDILFWEGEKKHRNDDRILSRNSEIHVFYRKRHHSNFTYKGKAQLRSYRLLISRPSKFSFKLTDQPIPESKIVQEIQSSPVISETEKKAIILSRRGQGLYRSLSIRLWKSCCVTGFERKQILIASHIKPWKVSSNLERISEYNSLLLVPTLDRLFDKGFISFEDNGKIRLSEEIAESEWKKIGVHRNMRLRQVPYDILHHLRYHNEYIFEMTTKRRNLE